MNKPSFWTKFICGTFGCKFDWWEGLSKAEKLDDNIKHFCLRCGRPAFPDAPSIPPPPPRRSNKELCDTRMVIDPEEIHGSKVKFFCQDLKNHEGVCHMRPVDDGETLLPRIFSTNPVNPKLKYFKYCSGRVWDSGDKTDCGRPVLVLDKCEKCLEKELNQIQITVRKYSDDMRLLRDRVDLLTTELRQVLDANIRK